MGEETAIYIRVSTPEQKTDLQIDGLKDYAERAGLDVTHEYVEHGVSGRKESRPRLNELMEQARNREFKNVLVWKFDRFARSTAHLLKALEEFNHLGIRFISVKDQVDTSSPIGKAMFVLVGAMAELEGDLIRERIKEGMKAARIRGRKPGRPKTPDRIVEKVQELASETDLSITQIYRQVERHTSRSVVGKIVQKVRNVVK